MSSSFTIGCDPELICRLNVQFVSAHHYFKANSSMGLDGCGSTAEIRPGYSESAIDLAHKIYQILEYGHDKAPDLEFYAGHFIDVYAVGGQVHFSVEPNNKIINALDTVLGSLSNCIDDKQQRQKREREPDTERKVYTEKKDHNGAGGFEYRTLGSWLLSPSVTLVNLTLAKLAVIGVIEDDLDFIEIKNGQHSMTFLWQLKNILPTIPAGCKEGLKELDFLLTKKLKWEVDILPNWGLRRAA